MQLAKEVIINLSTDLTDKELQNLIKKYLTPEFEGCTITIDGFNKDPRELYDIPEVNKFCQRLFDTGFAGLLKISKEHLTWGVVDVWSAAKKLYVKGRVELSLEQKTECAQDFKKAAELASSA